MNRIDPWKMLGLALFLSSGALCAVLILLVL